MARSKPPVVVITGASQGIGAAIARAFAAKVLGVRLALVARSTANLAAVARSCAKLGAQAVAFGCDVSDEAEVNRMAGEVLGRFKSVDVLVNNAGKYAGAPFLETSVADFDRMIASNLRGLFLVTKAFAPGMVRRRRGDIFNMGSIAGISALAGAPAYTAAKFGVKVRRVGVQGTTLDDVFLHYTGRQLRDAAGSAGTYDVSHLYNR